MSLLTLERHPTKKAQHSKPLLVEGVPSEMSASMMVHHVLDVVLTAEPAAAHKGSAIDGLVEFFKEGGPFMLINIFLLACSLAVVV